MEYTNKTVYTHKHDSLNVNSCDNSKYKRQAIAGNDAQMLKSGINSNSNNSLHNCHNTHPHLYQSH